MSRGDIIGGLTIVYLVLYSLQMVAMAARSEDSFSEATSVSDFAWSDEEETVVERREGVVVSMDEVVEKREGVEAAEVARGTWLRQAEVWRRQVTQFLASLQRSVQLSDLVIHCRLVQDSKVQQCTISTTKKNKKSIKKNKKVNFPQMQPIIEFTFRI